MLPTKNLKRKLSKLSFGILLLASMLMLSSWGYWGHQHIDRAAIFALPDAIRIFFYNHIDFITEESVVPDIRKHAYNFKQENPRHYIDIEAFKESVDNLPQTPKEAYQEYPDSFLQKNGTLPWYIQEMMAKLTTAFKEKRKTEILLLAADLGHYLGDAHMPLHTSLNHDGQLTGQIGIHSFWEAQLPEMFGNNYNLYTGDAKYIDDVTKETWRIIKDTHRLADTVLLTDKNLSATFTREQMYKFDDKGNMIKNIFNQPIHSDEYARKYHEALKGMIERQIRASITATANFWYTAWVNAGKPDLSKLDAAELTTRNKEYYLKDIEAWKKGKLTGLKIDNEF